MVFVTASDQVKLEVFCVNTCIHIYVCIYARVCVYSTI